MEGIRAAAGATAYEAMRARKSHLDGAGGLKWSPEVEDAVKALMSASERESVLVLMASDGERMNVGICPSDDSYPSPPPLFFFQTVDIEAETVVLKQVSNGLSPEQLSSVIPNTEPCKYLDSGVFFPVQTCFNAPAQHTHFTHGHIKTTKSRLPLSVSGSPPSSNIH